MRSAQALMEDIGNFIKTVFAGFATATAGGAGDATEVDGGWIDRLGYDSLVASMGFRAVLAQTQTLTLAANLQDADDDQGTGAADFGDALAATVVATGETGGSTEVGTKEVDFNLRGARRYVRLQFTPNLSAANTDTATVMAQAVLAGAVRSPV